MKQKMDSLGAIVTPLLGWYDQNARILPWRENPEPYWVWVSEIMLQQTRVEAVKPYYERFLTALPDVGALAQAPEEQLLKLWEGLGYYNRVRNLQKAAQVMVEKYNGQVPPSFEALRELPGIGEYTAGAISSIAFNFPVPAVDGNVLRVTSRLKASRDDILDPKVKKRTEQEIREIIPSRAGDFNQALMELGATVCVPNGMALCEKCPLSQLCQANQQGIVMELPVKAEKKPRRIEERTVFLLVSGGKAALRKRPKKGLLAGLWELPGTEGSLSPEEAASCLNQWGVPTASLQELGTAKHIFTHVEWRMTAYVAITDQKPDSFSWASRQELENGYALPFAFKAFTGRLKELCK